jgi:AAA domain
MDISDSDVNSYIDGLSIDIEKIFEDFKFNNMNEDFEVDPFLGEDAEVFGQYSTDEKTAKYKEALKKAIKGTLKDLGQYKYDA